MGSEGAHHPGLSLTLSAFAISRLASPVLWFPGSFARRRRLATDQQAIPLAFAFSALNPGFQPGAVTVLARYRHFFVH